MKLTEKQKLWLRGQAEIIVECLPEHISVRGNLVASGDNEADKRDEDAVIEDLENGNEWAWCCVKVSLHWKNYEGKDYLGACSYKSMSDFKENDYFPDMVSNAFDDLVSEIESDIDSFVELLNLDGAA